MRRERRGKGEGKEGVMGRDKKGEREERKKGEGEGTLTPPPHTHAAVQGIPG